MIYADHAATSPLSNAARAAMKPYLSESFGNPSTLYSFAREPRKAIREARNAIASAIHAEPEEIYFTSGGTESDNWALTGISFLRPERKGRLITSPVEHHAVLHTCNFLARMGYQIDFAPVDSQGVVSPEALDAILSEDAFLTSVMLANNEIGTIEPVADLAAVAHRHGSLFHTDAVQAVGHIPIDVKQLDVDLLSASAHKFNGPKGVGFLYIRKGIDIEPLLHGGAQENHGRAGTENVAGIVGMAAALQEHMDHLEEERKYLSDLSVKLLAFLDECGLDFIVNGSENRIPGSLSLSFRNESGEKLLHRLDLMGTAVATGSACDSKDAKLSHVIQAIHVPDEFAHGTIRITLGIENTEDEIHTIAEQIRKIIQH